VQASPSGIAADGARPGQRRYPAGGDGKEGRGLAGPTQGAGRARPEGRGSGRVSGRFADPGWELEGKEAWQKRLEPLKAANFGISGDKAQNVLWRITEGKELQGLKPRVIVLLVGTNNLGSDRRGQLSLEPDAPLAIADCVAAITSRLRKDLPEARILLLGILPRASEADAPVRGRVQDVNQRLATLAGGDKIRFLDVGAKFLDKDGRIPEELMPDALHLSPKGYDNLAEALAPVLEEMLKKAAE
jgi:lysophospholipase L1-like esterase